MDDIGTNRSTGVRIIHKAFQVGWKVALAAAVAAAVVWYLWFVPVPVASQVAEFGPIVAEVMGTGTLEARVQASISAKISGLLTQVLVDQGDCITKGQLLATLDDSDLREQVEVAKAEVAASTATLHRTEAEIDKANATLIFAGLNLKRFIQLRTSSSAASYELDQATEQRDVAEAEVKRSQRAKVEAEKMVAKAEASLRYYQELLAYAKIFSPFDGLVTRRSRDPGNIVVPGTEILQIISTAQLWVSAWVDETAMASLTPDQPARIVFRSEPDKSYPGTVTRLAPLADRETREFLVDVTLRDLPKAWAVGQRAEVYIQTARKDRALLVPQRAIVWQKGRAGLYVNEAGRAHWRSVSLGLRGTDKVEVTQGLTAGERVIWLNDPKDGSLTEGRAVSPVKMP